MTGTFHIIGVGPGDPELLTLKALRIIKQSQTLFVPKGKENGNSTALAIIEEVLSTDDKEIIEIHFPMKKIHIGHKPDPEVEQAWQSAAAGIIAKVREGKNVVFPTLGDPAIYSTGFYLCQTLQTIAPELQINIIPGVSSIGACAAAAGIPLCLGDEMLAIVPATFNDNRLTSILQTFNTVVLMKVHKVMDRLLPILEDLGLTDNAVLVERLGHDSQRTLKNIKEIKEQELHYFATLIVRKKW